MAERLTEKVFDNNGKQQDIYEWSSASSLECNKKLGMLEDIMEKYDIESFELLEHIIKKGKVINSVIEDFAKEEYDKIKQDRDTWKRACELACEEIDSCDNYGCKTYTIPLKEMPQYFYQQAKKEGNYERN